MLFGDLNFKAVASDKRRLDAMAGGFAFKGGAQSAYDATFKSVSSSGAGAKPRSADRDGIIADIARQASQRLIFPQVLEWEALRLRRP